MRNVKGTMSSNVRLGRLGLPIWALVITVMAMAAMVAAAGQAVGPVLSGQINGTTGLVVGQAIVLDTTASSAHAVTDTEDGVIVVSDDGTGFTAAMEAFRGTTGRILLDLKNKGTQDSAALITIIAPRGVEIDANEVTGEADGVAVAKMSRNTWLMTVPNGETGGDQDVELSLTGEPGYFTVQASIVQIAAG